MRLLFIIFLFPISLFSQEQVSNVVFGNRVPYTVFNEYSGFVNLQEKNYFLLDQDSLLIFEATGDSLQLLHTILESSHVEFQLKIRLNDHKSGLAIQGNNYFRSNGSGIHVVDITNGEIVSQLKMDTTIYTLSDLIKVIDDYVFIRVFGEENARLVIRYNWKTQEIVELPSFFVDLGYRIMIDQRFYFDDKDQKRVMSVDGYTSEVDTIFQYQGKLEMFQRNSNFGTEYIILKDETGIYLIDETFELKTIECLDTSIPDIKTVNLHAGKLITSEWNSATESDWMRVTDMYSCEELQYFETIGDHYSWRLEFYDNHQSDISMFSYRETSPTRGYTYIIDHTLGKTVGANVGNYPYNGSMIVKNNIAYCISYSAYNQGPSFINLLIYDATEQSLEQILPYEDSSSSTILGYINKNEELIFLANSSEYDPKLWKVDQENAFTPLMNVNYKGNIGVGTRLGIRTKGDEVFSIGTGGLMFTENTTKHLHSAYIYSDLIITDDEYGAVFLKNDSFFVVATNKTENTIEEKYISEGRKITNINDNLSIGGFLFNYDFFDSRTYYDLKQRKKKFLISQGDTLYVWGIAGGTDFLLLKTWHDFNHAIYSFDTKTEQLKKITGAFEQPRHMYTAKDNTFYLVKSDFQNDNTQIQRYSPNSGLELIYNGVGFQANHRNITPESNIPVRAIELRLEDKTRVVLDNGTQTQTIDLDNVGGSIFAGSRNSDFIFRTFANEENKAYYFEFGQEPILIGSDVELKLSFAHFDESKVLLFYDKGFESGFKVDQYDINKSLTTEIVDIDFGYKLIGTGIATIKSGKSYLLPYAGLGVGREPFILDIENKSFEALADLSSGVENTTPRAFTTTENYIYFTAQTEDRSVQWFRIEPSVINGIEQPIVKSLEKLKVFPNPTNDFISLDSDFKSISIIGTTGEIVKPIANYKKQNKIDVSQFPPGVYFIQGQANNKVVYGGSFILLKK